MYKLSKLHVIFLMASLAIIDAVHFMLNILGLSSNAEVLKQLRYLFITLIKNYKRKDKLQPTLRVILPIKRVYRIALVA